MITSITNLLTYYPAEIYSHSFFSVTPDVINDTNSASDIKFLVYNVGKYTYEIEVTPQNIQYQVSKSKLDNLYVGNVYTDETTHAKLYALFLERRQQAWDNFLEITRVPIPDPADDGYAQLMD